MPVDPDYKLVLGNSDSTGKIVAQYEIPASHIQKVLQYIGFNNIPFDHSVGILGVFSNMFYPTDNLHTGDSLGYYRQREWRLIAGDVNFNGRPIGRSLSDAQSAKLIEIDPRFWTRELELEGVRNQQSTLALVYDPIPGWNFFDLVEAIFVPKNAVEKVRAIVGVQIPIHSHS